MDVKWIQANEIWVEFQTPFRASMWIQNLGEQTREMNSKQTHCVSTNVISQLNLHIPYTPRVFCRWNEKLLILFDLAQKSESEIQSAVRRENKELRS